MFSKQAVLFFQNVVFSLERSSVSINRRILVFPEFYAVNISKIITSSSFPSSDALGEQLAIFYDMSGVVNIFCIATYLLKMFFLVSILQSSVREPFGLD